MRNSRGFPQKSFPKSFPCRRLARNQACGDRSAIRLRFRALSAEMAAPSAAVERDTLARCGIFTGLFACVYVRHFLRRRAQEFFARGNVTFTVLRPARPCEFPTAAAAAAAGAAFTTRPTS